jgi:hypothetical protein
VYHFLGVYSTHNETVLRAQLSIMRNVSMNTFVVPWDGAFIDVQTANNTNKTLSFSDQTLALLFKLASQYKIDNIPLFPSIANIIRPSIYHSPLITGDLENRWAESMMPTN